jgi:hypothetical protein
MTKSPAKTRPFDPQSIACRYSRKDLHPAADFGAPAAAAMIGAKGRRLETRRASPRLAGGGRAPPASRIVLESVHKAAER